MRIKHPILCSFALFVVGSIAAIPVLCQTEPAPDAAKDVPVLDAISQSQVVMYVGAHPDDENSIDGLLARITGEGKKLYMVCFTRGENEPMDVGPRKGEEMAQARMQWLRDSAALLGAEPIQLPYTDGPSTVAELERGVIRYWPRTATVDDVIAQWRKIDRDPYEDMVRLIREKQPDLILTWEETQGWTGNAEHRTVATLAQRAFYGAADPRVFSEQLRAGLKPWQPNWLYRVLRGDGADVHGRFAQQDISCDAPGPSGRNACDVKGSVMMSYSRHTMRTASPEQLAQKEKAAGMFARQHPEHVQLALVAPRP